MSDFSIRLPFHYFIPERKEVIKKKQEEIAIPLELPKSFEAFDEKTKMAKRAERSAFENQFDYIQSTKDDFQNFDAKDLKLLHFLETTNKILYVALAILGGILCPLAFMYAPVWVPFGIGFPLSMILSWVNSKIEGSIAYEKHQENSLAFVRKMLPDMGVHALHPITEGDLTEENQKLGSDIMMEAELDKKPFIDARDFEFTVGNKTGDFFSEKRKKKFVVDIDVSPFVKIHAARELSQYSNVKADWNQARRKAREVKAKVTDKTTKEEFKAFLDEVEIQSLKVGGFSGGEKIKLEKNQKEMPIETFLQQIGFYALLPHTTPKDRIRSLISLYAFLVYKQQATFKTYREAAKLFADYAPFQEVIDECKDLNDSILSLKKEIEPLISRLKLTFNHEIETVDEWHAILGEVEEKNLFVKIEREIQRCMRTRFGIQYQINLHPETRLNCYKKNLDLLEKRDMLSEETAAALELHLTQNQKMPKEASKEIEKWYDCHPDHKKISLNELYQRNAVMRQRLKEVNKARIALDEEFFDLKHRDMLSEETEKSLELYINQNQAFTAAAHKEIKKWLDRHPDLNGISPQELHQRNVILRQKYDEKIRSLQALKKEFSDLKHYENYFNDFNNFMMKLEVFEKTVYIPTKERLGFLGVEGFFKIWKNALFRKDIPNAKPFSELHFKPTDSDYIKHKKIEELQVQSMLKSLDKNMILKNLGRQLGIPIALSVFFIAESILILLTANPWVTCGVMVATMILEVFSFYMVRRVKQMDREKQSLKLQVLLYDMPNISRTFGSRVKDKKSDHFRYDLEDLRRVQQKYDLDGVRPTWSKALMQNGEVQILAKKVNAEEGRKIVERSLGVRLKALNSLLYRVEKVEAEKKKKKEAEKKSNIPKREDDSKKEALKLEAKVKEAIKRGEAHQIDLRKELIEKRNKIERELRKKGIGKFEEQREKERVQEYEKAIAELYKLEKRAISQLPTKMRLEKEKERLEKDLKSQNVKGKSDKERRLGQVKNGLYHYHRKFRDQPYRRRLEAENERLQKELQDPNVKGKKEKERRVEKIEYELRGFEISDVEKSRALIFEAKKNADKDLTVYKEIVAAIEGKDNQKGWLLLKMEAYEKKVARGDTLIKLIEATLMTESSINILAPPFHVLLKRMKDVEVPIQTQDVQNLKNYSLDLLRSTLSALKIEHTQNLEMVRKLKHRKAKLEKELEKWRHLGVDKNEGLIGGLEADFDEETEHGRGVEKLASEIPVSFKMTHERKKAFFENKSKKQRLIRQCLLKEEIKNECAKQKPDIQILRSLFSAFENEIDKKEAKDTLYLLKKSLYWLLPLELRKEIDLKK